MSYLSRTWCADFAGKGVEGKLANLTITDDRGKLPLTLKRRHVVQVLFVGWTSSPRVWNEVINVSNCSEARWHTHALVRGRPAHMLWHRNRSLHRPRNHRQDARRCRDYKISDERPVDAFSSPTRSPRQQHRLQGSREHAAARKTLCYDSKSRTPPSVPSLAKPTPYVLKGFATLHRASGKRPLGHPACSFSPLQYLQRARTISPALVPHTAGDRRPRQLVTHVHLTPRQSANPLTPNSF